MDLVFEAVSDCQLRDSRVANPFEAGVLGLRRSLGNGRYALEAHP